MAMSKECVVALKYGTLALHDPKEDYDPGFYTGKKVSGRWLANRLGLSQSEIVKANARLLDSMLIRPDNNEIVDGTINLPYQLVTRNMLEWLCYGIRYYLPPKKIGIVRGIATGWSCEYVNSEMAPPEMPLVWQKNHGSITGEGIEPIYKEAPLACEDLRMYRILALVDIMRIGRPRELKVASELIKDILRDISNAQ